MKKFLASALALVLALSFTACDGNGDTPSGSGGNNTQGGGNSGDSTKFTGTYKYKPVTDNVYIEWKSGEHTYFAAIIGRGFCFMPTEEMVTYIDYSTGKGWSRAIDGTDWIEDDYDYTDTEDTASFGPLSAMEDFFMKYFRAFGKEDSELSEFYVGMEKVAGVNCWIFDTQGLNAIEMKYWIDPSNGCCLKYLTKDDGYTDEITEYNLNYTSWGANMKP